MEFSLSAIADLANLIAPKEDSESDDDAVSFPITVFLLDYETV